MRPTVLPALRFPLAALLLLGPLPAALAQPTDGKHWRDAEKGILADHVQLTFDHQFTKAGEAYFCPQKRWIVFQAVAVPAEGERPDPFYAMYVARLRFEQDRIVGIDEPIQVSPPGSANTCGWFHPTEPGRILFGSTIDPPTATEAPGFQREGATYRWMFPPEMNIVTMVVPEIVKDAQRDVQRDDKRAGPSSAPAGLEDEPARAETGLEDEPARALTKITDTDTYDAEASLSNDGRFLLYCSMQPAPNFGDIFILDLETNISRPIVVAEGYDGGPFFSPDNRRICYRSDRKGDNHLQLFVGELDFDDRGVPVGLKREVQITDNRHVNWAPYWHPDGRHLAYATSEIGHFQYEIFIIDVDGQRRSQRVTHAPGFDGLPVFSHDGQWLMWTSQRAEKPDERGASQLWVARFVMELD